MASPQPINITAQAEPNTAEHVCVGVEAKSKSPSTHVLTEAIDEAGTSELREDCAEKDVPLELHNILEVKEEDVTEKFVSTQSAKPGHGSASVSDKPRTIYEAFLAYRTSHPTTSVTWPEYFAVAESIIGPFHYNDSDSNDNNSPPSYELAIEDSYSGVENTHSEVIKANHNLFETDIGPGLFVYDIVGATNGGNDDTTPPNRVLVDQDDVSLDPSDLTTSLQTRYQCEVRDDQDRVLV